MCDFFSDRGLPVISNSSVCVEFICVPFGSRTLILLDVGCLFIHLPAVIR